MTDEGMKGVANPSDILITQKEDQLSGIAIAATIEGIRPLLIEVQALVTQSVYGTPQRTMSGFDLRRMQLLLAVLGKRGGFIFGVRMFFKYCRRIKNRRSSIDLLLYAPTFLLMEDVPLHAKYLFCR